MTASVSFGCKACAQILGRGKGTRCKCPLCGRRYDANGDEIEDVAHDRPRNARADMAALARWRPHIDGRGVGISPIVGDGNKGGTSPNALAGRPDYVDERNQDLRKALDAEARLTAMRASGEPEGKRYADVVWFAYGKRGTDLNEREGAGASITVAFALPGEFKRWREVQDLTDVAATIAFGNLLLGAAQMAYERDECRGIPMPAIPPVTKRQEFIARAKNSFAAWRDEQARQAAIPPAHTHYVHGGGECQQCRAEAVLAIADACGYKPRTVSLVLNAKNVRDSIAAKVRSAVESLGLTKWLRTSTDKTESVQSNP